MSAVSRILLRACVLLALVVVGSGCGKKAPTRAEQERQFLAPTDVNKLSPEARSHLPGGGKFQPTGR
jgi:hypothetical protein